jgi:16S rRNA (uracil1498-N3)-methyltransferase
VHYFFDPAISEKSETISKDELVHFMALRIEVGEQISISAGNGTGVLAEVLDPVLGQIKVLRKLSEESKVGIHLVQAIAKGGRDESALQACAELGIASATALQAERSVARWDSKIEKNLARWQQIAISATKQSQQLRLPEVRYSPSVKELVPSGVGLVLDPRADNQIGSVPKADSYSVVVGPEGGFTQSELEALEDRGFVRVRLGESILRTSTAGVVAISCLQLISGQFGKPLDLGPEV